ncbi:isoprenoid synthase domain-containing protein, partial [Gorgonomyces haynaldii]
MNYWQVHQYLLLPSLFLSLLVSYPIFSVDPARTLYPICALALIAFVYTTPWDNYLIYKGGWSYDNSVLFVIGYVPFEEYLFFVVQSLFVGTVFAMYTWIYGTFDGLLTKSNKPFLYLASGLFAVGVSCLSQTKSFYLGMILTWSMPVLMIQLYVAHDYIVGQIQRHFGLVSALTGYLWLIDSIAIKYGAWTIGKDTILGIYLNPWLPLEEAVFFLVTNLMLVGGILAIERTLVLISIYPGLELQYKQHPIETVLKTTFSDNPKDTKPISDLVHCRTVTRNASSSFYLSTLLLPYHLRYKFWKLYAFCRTADDLIDENPNTKENIDKLSRIIKNRERMDDPVFRSLHSLDLPLKPLMWLLEGFEWDSKQSIINTEKELDDYCFQVASSVGHLSMYLFYDNPPPELFEKAHELGKAMQLINICRDVKEDWVERKRIYIPGLSKQDIQAYCDSKSDKVQQKILQLLDRADGYHVLDAIYKLPRFVQRSVLGAYLFYDSIGKRIRTGK